MRRSCLLALLAAPALAQTDAPCSIAAQVEAMPPVQAVSPDAPIFAPLQWGMSRAETRRALVGDGWRSGPRDGMPARTDQFLGEMFGADAALWVEHDGSGRTTRVYAFIQDPSSLVWDRTVWDEVKTALVAGYGPPDEEQESMSSLYDGSPFCSTFGRDGGSTVFAVWSTVRSRVGTECFVSVLYDGPGAREAERAELLADARETDRTCRAELAETHRDRSRLAPAAESPLPLPPRVAPRVPPIPGATTPRQAAGTGVPAADEEVFDVVEQPPVLIGGLTGLQLLVEYPDFVRRAGIEGTVYLQFVVGPDGSARDIRAVRSPNDALSEAAVRAVQQVRFEPGRQRGQPVAVRYSLPVRFALR